jgi:site-specific recombinase XerD
MRRKIKKVEVKSSEVKIKKIHQELPQEVIEALTSLSRKEQYRYIYNLKKAGWTYNSFARLLGVTREAVRCGVDANHAKDFPHVETLPVPSPPTYKSKPPTFRNEEVDEETLSRLKELHEKARLVRYNHKHYRDEAEIFTKMIYDLYLQGYSLSTIGNQLGLNPKSGSRALYFRLVRYGYLETKGTSHALRKVIHRKAE